MKNAKIAITSILSLTIAGQAQAQPEPEPEPFTYVGSDTLEPIIKELLATGSCGNINYVGAGSGAGFRAMVAGTQQTAPMSSPMPLDQCGQFPNPSQNAIGVDKLIVTRNNGDADSTCDTQFKADISDYESAEAPSWAEALQLIYGGKDGLGTPEACNDPARKDLIQNWNKIWDNACDDGKCPNGLRYAFRRGDSSGTTKVFMDTIGIQAFCNGNQFEDEDPVRTDCFDSDDVDYCDSDKGDTLGVVQAVFLEGIPLEGRKRCEKGSFGFTFESDLNGELFDGSCPDNSPPVATFLCLYPKDCDDNFGCTSFYSNVSPLDPLMDGRIYNKLRSQPDAAEQPFPLKDEEDNVLGQLAAVYFNGNCSGGKEQKGTSSTKQIGCLVNQVECSIGFGGKTQAAAEITNSVTGDTCGTVTTASNTVTELDGAGLNESGYPLSRRLFISTLELTPMDCDQIADLNERALCKCIFEDEAGPDALANAVSNANFDPITGGSVQVACGQK